MVSQLTTALRLRAFSFLRLKDRQTDGPPYPLLAWLSVAPQVNLSASVILGSCMKYGHRLQVPARRGLGPAPTSHTQAYIYRDTPTQTRTSTHQKHAPCHKYTRTQRHVPFHRQAQHHWVNTRGPLGGGAAPAHHCMLLVIQPWVASGTGRDRLMQEL